MKPFLPKLDFAPDALRSLSSAETFEYHHGKHHRGYVDKLVRMLDGSPLSDLSLTELVVAAEGALFDNAAQHYNHSFYWRCITPGTTGPKGALLAALERDFGGRDGFEASFREAAVGHFGSGWCWLVKDPEGRLGVRTTSDAGCPLTVGEVPLLTCDVWEHAYYIDYRNARRRYVEHFMQAVNWSFVDLAFTRPAAVEAEILGSPQAP